MEKALNESDRTGVDPQVEEQWVCIANHVTVMPMIIDGNLYCSHLMRDHNERDRICGMGLMKFRSYD